MRLEKHVSDKKIDLTDEQIRLLERFSPEFRERQIETRHTGDLVAVDTFFVRHLYILSMNRLRTPAKNSRPISVFLICPSHLILSGDAS